MNHDLRSGLLLVLSIFLPALAQGGDAGLPLGYGATFKVMPVASGQITREAIFMHPPWKRGVSGKVAGTFDIDLPRNRDLRLVMAVGIRDGVSGVSGVQFDISVDGHQLYERYLDKPGGWREVEVDLSRYAGSRISLEIAVDSMGHTGGDWSAIAEPRIVSADGVVTDLLKLALSADTRVILSGQVGKVVMIEHEIRNQAIVLVNQIGYDAGAPKSFLVQVPGNISLPGRYRVKLRDGGRVMYEGGLESAGSVKGWQGFWGKLKYARGDFSEFDRPGEYLIEVDAPAPVSSVPFHLGDNLQFATLVPYAGLEFLRGRRSQEGGWKSDTVKSQRLVLFAIGPALYGLAGTLEAQPGFWRGNARNSAIREVRWGFEGLRAAQQAEGRFVGSQPDGRDDVYAGIGIAALASLARADYLTTDERQDALERAIRSRAYYRNFTLTQFGKGSVEGLFHALMVLADLELYNTTGDHGWLEDAAAEATLAAAEWERHWPHSSGWANEIWQGGIVPGCLLRLALASPELLPVNAEDILRRWVLRVRELTTEQPAYPFQILPWDESHFFNPNRGKWYVAENGRYIAHAWAMSLAARWLKDATFRALALENLNWIAGVNPTGRTMIKGIGVKRWPSWYGTIGEDEGAIMNGLRSRDATDDSPYLDDVAYSTCEPWTPYNGWLLVALNEWVALGSGYSANQGDAAGE